MSDVETSPTHRCAFTGCAADYFRIWIVNLLLTLLTLGLWSPWAKVRKRRYFYGHTWIAGANFEYHGDPLAILRGRLIAASAFATYWFVDHLQPALGPWLLFALLTAAPWIVARSLAFNAANSSHRGIRFRFDGTAREVAAAIWPLFLWPLVLWLAQSDNTDFTLRKAGMLIAAGASYAVLVAAYPFAVARVRRLMVARSSWGECPFTTTLRTRQVYAIYGIAVLLGMGGLLVAGAVGAGIGAAIAFLARDSDGGTALLVLLTAGFMLGYFVVGVLVMGYTRSRMGNLVFDTAALGTLARFRSRVKARRLMRLYVGNIVAILASVGMLIPWAVVRVARYRIESLAVLPSGPVDAISAGVVASHAATGEELGEVFGFDLAL